MKKSIVALGIVLALSGCAAAADETLAAEPAALVEISPATEENAQPVEAAATAEPAQTATPAPTPEPTQAPTPAPTAEPTAVPTSKMRFGCFSARSILIKLCISLRMIGTRSASAFVSNSCRNGVFPISSELI